MKQTIGFLLLLLHLLFVGIEAGTGNDVDGKPLVAELADQLKTCDEEGPKMPEDANKEEPKVSFLLLTSYYDAFKLNFKEPEEEKKEPEEEKKEPEEEEKKEPEEEEKKEPKTPEKKTAGKSVHI